MKYIQFGNDIITNPERALPYEWLETNGLGSYSTSNIYLCHSRKYHGLLVANVDDINEKISFLSKYLTFITINGVRFDLSTNRYPRVYHPNSYKYMERFSYENNYPQIYFKIGDVEICTSFLMVKNQDTILMRFDVLKSKNNITFNISPLLSFRNFHGLHKKNMGTRNSLQKDKGQWFAQPYDNLPPLYFKISANTKYYAAPETYENIEYLKEQQRGYDFSEDLYSPGIFEKTIGMKDSLIIQASLQKNTKLPEEQWRKTLETRLKHNEKIIESIPAGLKKNATYSILKQNAYKFLIGKKRKKLPSIIAGYPWFGEWGRDTMISVSGLTLYNNKVDDFLPILKTYASFEKRGLFPNQLSTTGNSSYNNIDASLWFFQAIEQYLDFYHAKHEVACKEIAKHFKTTIQNILLAFLENRVPYTQLQADGFLASGNQNTQLTWMDATVHGRPVTPRYGFPIEINALWYKGLAIYEAIAPKGFKGNLAPLKKIKKSLEENFEKQYFIPHLGYLGDNLAYGKAVEELRPNQLVALAMPALISDDTAKICLTTIERKLLTPFGLRTLNVTNPMYKSAYRGSQENRDGAYHQGTIWPFLFGIYTDALLRVYGGNKKKITSHQKYLLDFVENTITTRGLGGLAEVHDGNIPHRYRGCPFQAWSISEVIRSIEKIEKIK